MLMVGGRGQKSKKIDDVLNGWSLMRRTTDKNTYLGTGFKRVKYHRCVLMYEEFSLLWDPMT